MKKIAVGLLTILLLVCMLPFSAFASSGGIATCADLCSYCGNGEMRYKSTEYTSWERNDRKLCEHGNPAAVDWIEERDVRVVYECDNCGMCDIYKHTERRIICGA